MMEGVDLDLGRLATAARMAANSCDRDGCPTDKEALNAIRAITDQLTRAGAIPTEHIHASAENWSEARVARLIMEAGAALGWQSVRLEIIPLPEPKVIDISITYGEPRES